MVEATQLLPIESIPIQADDSIDAGRRFPYRRGLHVTYFALITVKLYHVSNQDEDWETWGEWEAGCLLAVLLKCMNLFINRC